MDKLRLVLIAGSLFVMTAGTAMHFLYAHARFTWPIAPINETPWEHLKLIFWPSVFFLPAEQLITGISAGRIAAAKSVGLFVSMAFILLAFYIYLSLAGKDVFFLDIGIFIAACCLSYLVQNAVLAAHMGLPDKGCGYIGLGTMAGVFIFFTKKAPWNRSQDQ